MIDDVQERLSQNLSLLLSSRLKIRLCYSDLKLLFVLTSVLSERLYATFSFLSRIANRCPALPMSTQLYPEFSTRRSLQRRKKINNTPVFIRYSLDSGFWVSLTMFGWDLTITWRVFPVSRRGLFQHIYLPPSVIMIFLSFSSILYLSLFLSDP